MGRSLHLLCPQVEEWRLLLQSLSRLASLLAEKSDVPYLMMMNLIRCRLSFSLLDSSIMCIRGARSILQNTSYIAHNSPALIAAAIE